MSAKVRQPLSSPVCSAFSFTPLCLYLFKKMVWLFFIFLIIFFISKRTKLLFAWPAFFRNYLLIQNSKSLCNFLITCTKNSAIFKFKNANVINSQFINRKYKTALHWILTTNSQLQYMTYKAYYVYTNVYQGGRHVGRA